MAVGMEGRAENRIGALPRLQVAFLCMTDAAHFYTVCSLFSYAGVLTADMHWTEDKNDAGFVAGWLQSANVCGRIVTSSLWGLVMQRHGPKPVLAATLFGLLAGGILFSFCTNLAGAMCIRFIFLGMFNGWPVLVAPCAAAVAGDARQTQVLGLIIACGSGTQLVGPGIGGWTYGLVPGYPAMLPSSIGCILAIATIAVFLRVRRAFELVEEEEATPKLRRSSKAALFRFPVPLLLWMRFCQGFAVFGVYEAIPLWLISDKALGGLGLSEKEVGSLLSRSGLWSIIYFSFIMPSLIPKHLSPRFFSILTSCTAGVTAVLLPYASTVPLANVLHLIFACTFVSQAAVNMQFTNNATGPQDRSVITGVAVTVETIGKALSPVAMSWLFAWSLQRFGKEGHDLVFVVLAALALMQLTCSLFLPSSVDGSEAVQTEDASPVGAAKVPASKIGGMQHPQASLRERSPPP